MLKLAPGLAQKLMHGLEEMSDAKLCYFVDLFVRVSNSIAISFYKKLGYTVYRTVLQYYSGENDEDAYDMRKALTIDVDKKSVIPKEEEMAGVPDFGAGNPASGGNSGETAAG